MNSVEPLKLKFWKKNIKMCFIFTECFWLVFKTKFSVEILYFKTRLVTILAICFLILKVNRSPTPLGILHMLDNCFSLFFHQVKSIL